MGNIQDYLDKIKNAVFGKDVRQAIHDGIQQCYYDGKAGTIDLEARQNIQTLSDEKADRTEIANMLEHSDVVDNLLSDSTNLPLSANQGKVLKEKQDALETNVAGVSGLRIQSGNLSSLSANANSYADKAITFPVAFSSVPDIVVGFYSTTDSVTVGNTAVAVKDATKTGFTIRLYNASSATRAPGIRWIAVG